MKPSPLELSSDQETRLLLDVNDALEALKTGLMIMRSGSDFFIFDKRNDERLSINAPLSDLIATGISCIRALPGK